MPPSQLKALKASLREAGITGPQESKKQKRNERNGRASNGNIDRNVKLQQLRDSFNPFELRAPSARPSKHDHTTNGQLKYKDVLHRPGVAKSVGEDMRRAKLLPEIQRRHKVGGLIDRRIGESDRRMTAEEKALERVAAGFKMKGSKAKNLFDLEDSDGGEDMETAPEWRLGGKTVAELPQDDFDEQISADDSDDLTIRKRKRSGSLDSAHESNDVSRNGAAEDEPERKKSKKEVMEEVIAKSKLHKYERQKAKEDDDDLREQLDKDMPDLLSLLRSQKPSQPLNTQSTGSTLNGNEPFMDPGRQRLLDDGQAKDVNREYDVRLRQLAQDAKAKPSERTKTVEEKAKEEADKLRELEERRLKRMKGEETEQLNEGVDEDNEINGDLEVGADEAADFGFQAPTTNGHSQKQVTLDDEDEFAWDDDLIASDEDVGVSDESDAASQSEDEAHDGEQSAIEMEEDEFVKGILGNVALAEEKSEESRLAYTYPCPRSHTQLVEVIQPTSIEQLPTIIQRIRALYHTSLNESNKEALADFSAVLVEHLSYMGLEKQPLHVVEQVIRHLHSLCRTYSERIGRAFREQLKDAHQRKELHAGDLVVLTAIGSIFPTSDHWHQVATPAMTIIARWLGLNTPDTEEKARTGAYLVGLSVKFQHLSKRVVPEALRFTFCALNRPRDANVEGTQEHAQNLMSMADLWKEKSAFIEMFQPALAALKQSHAKKEYQTLQILLQRSRIRRRPLELHHHKPLPIRTSIPKFEEGFHPDKHYDPDKEWSESKKLKNEYKRERKGALRELRKDANFIAREQLREKREKDAEYEKKYRRLVAEVQGEAGHDANEYEREKRKRKRKQ